MHQPARRTPPPHHQDRRGVRHRRHHHDDHDRRDRKSQPQQHRRTHGRRDLPHHGQPAQARQGRQRDLRLMLSEQETGETDRWKACGSHETAHSIAVRRTFQDRPIRHAS